MTEADETLEDIAASLLNGVMIFLIGAAFPALFIWQGVVQWGGWTIGWDRASFVAGSQVLTLAIFSFLFLRRGFRMVLTSMAALRRRHRPFSID